MDAILDLPASLEKVRAWLRNGAQICAWIGLQVADAEQQIRRIEQRLREGAPVVVNHDPAPRTDQQQQTFQPSRSGLMSGVPKC